MFSWSKTVDAAHSFFLPANVSTTSSLPQGFYQREPDLIAHCRILVQQPVIAMEGIRASGNQHTQNGNAKNPQDSGQAKPAQPQVLSPKQAAEAMVECVEIHR